MKLYNSLTRKIEHFKPLKKAKVGLYTCGPTVYDHAHIGNLRTYIFEDTLRRALRLEGYDLKHVMNITDIEDKIIARSQEAYPGLEHSVAMHKLTSLYTRVFLRDVTKVGINLVGSKLVNATDHIAEMQKLIERIPARYIAEDGVYFDITKYPNYGVLTKLDRSHTHHRINNDEYDKEHVADFALWKVKNGNEPSWPFELENTNLEGRPGWHIECSAMSVHYLGQPFDIHTGGVDLKFPHHENEIAQSRAAAKKDLAKYWLHGEHLLVDGKKMSKSLKNFYTLEDITKKGFDALAFRLLVLQAHYRSQLNFTWESLQAAQNHLNSLRAWADLRWQATVDKPYAGFDEHWKKALEGINVALLDDLNTPKALAIISELADWLVQNGIPKQDSKHSAQALQHIDEALGFNLAKRADITSEQKQLIKQREASRTAKDFTQSDKIRKQLEKQGVGLNDGQAGATWYRLDS